MTRLPSPYWIFLNSDMSQLFKPGPRTVLIPESLPMLPFGAGAKQLVLMYSLIVRSPRLLFGLQVKTTRGAKSSLPVTSRFRAAPLAAVVKYDGVSGVPTLKLERPDNCQPPRICRVMGLSRAEIFVARFGMS